MGRSLGEVAVVVFAIILSIAIIAPAIQVAQSGLAITPYDEAILVLGMVFGLMAPISYFMARVWWTRALALLGSAVSAVCVALASYLFESHQPLEGVLTLALLAGMVFAVERVSKYRNDQRRKSLDALEALVMYEIAQAVRDYNGEDVMPQTAAPVVSLARQMAQSEAWAVIHEANTVSEAQTRLDLALATLQHDLGENRTIDSAAVAVKLVAAMRTRLARLDPQALETRLDMNVLA